MRRTVDKKLKGQKWNSVENLSEPRNSEKKKRYANDVIIE
jgi:hypothetical protein